MSRPQGKQPEFNQTTKKQNGTFSANVFFHQSQLSSSNSFRPLLQSMTSSYMTGLSSGRKTQTTTQFSFLKPNSNVQSQKQKSQSSIYEQYIKTLESEIFSREKERVELQKNLEEIKGDNMGLFNELHQENKRLCSQIKRIEQMQMIIQQINQKFKDALNQKQTFSKQLQLQMQRNSNLESAQQNVRQHLQRIQSELNIKSSQYLAKINTLRQESISQKTKIQQLEQKIKSLQTNTQGFKRQIIQITKQRTRTIETILIQRTQLSNNLQRQTDQLSRVKRENKQKDDKARQLMRDAQQKYESYNRQLDLLKFNINQLEFQVKNLKKQNQFNRQNFARDQHFLLQENNQLKSTIINLQKKRAADLSHINVLEKDLQKLKSQKFHLSIQNSVRQTDRQKLQICFDGQRKMLQKQIQELEIQLERQSFSLQSSIKRIKLLSSQLLQVKQQSSNQIQGLIQEMNFLKQQNHHKSSQFSTKIQKIIHQKQQLQIYYKEQSEKEKNDFQNQMISKLEELRKQYLIKQAQTKLYYEQDIIKGYQDKCQQLEALTHKTQEEAQKKLYRTIEQKDKQAKIIIQNQRQKDQIIYKKLQDQIRHQLMQKSITVKSLSDINLSLQQENTNLALQILKIKEQMRKNQETFSLSNEQLNKHHHFNMQRLKEQNQNQIKSHQFNHSELKKQTDKHIQHLEHTIKQVKEQKALSIQQKQRVEITLRVTEENYAKTVADLKHKILSLQHENAELFSLMNRKERDIAGKYEQLKKYEKKEYEDVIEAHLKQNKELENYFISIFSCISSLIIFVNKFCQNLPIKQNSAKSLVSMSKLQLCDNFKIYSELITAFIKQKMVALQKSEDENFALKQRNIFCQKQIIGLNQKIKCSAQKIGSLQSQIIKNMKQLQKVSLELEKQRFEGIQSIKNLKEKIIQYKQQLSRYESDINQISEKFESYETVSYKAQQKIEQLAEQVSNYQTQIKKIKQENLNTVNQLNLKHAAQTMICLEENQTKIRDLKEEMTENIKRLENQIIYTKDKLNQAEKIIERKNQKYADLESHFNLGIQRMKEEFNTKIHRYREEIDYLQINQNQGNMQIINRRSQLLQTDLRSKEQQIKTLEETNALLRKNIISSIDQKQSLKIQIRSNRSRSGTKSREKIKRDTSQQLRTKYLNGKVNLDKSNTNINESRSSKSYSNLKHLPQKMQGSINQQSSYQIPHLIIRSGIRNSRKIETQRPVSNFQRSIPNVPLDLKRHKDRKQKMAERRQFTSARSPQQQPLQNLNYGDQALKSYEQIIDIISPIKLFSQRD